MLLKIFQWGGLFAAVYIPYLALSHRWQNRLLLAASCIFYAACDWRCIFLIFVSITTDYLCGLKIYEASDERIKKRFLLLSLFINLSILGFFKYFDFFISNFAQLFHCLGFSIHPPVLQILLPLGISFYTFKTISYTIDVYTERFTPTRSYLDYALFVIFFPLILAGPIMRAKDLLGQITEPRKLRLDWFYEGCYLIFWGIFQKCFIADNLAIIADKTFAAAPPYSGFEVLLAVYAFAFQLFCDFDGYSNIARGLGRCMGFDITINFNLPYFATNPQDFWNRWHISLSTWLRDYLYTPIAVSKRYWGVWGVAFSLMVTFLLCGLWHGAAWTFVLWGGYWGVLLTIYAAFKPLLFKKRSRHSTMTAALWRIVRIIFFFHVTCLGWLIFRAQSLGQAYDMLHSLFSNFTVISVSHFMTGQLALAGYLWLLLAVQVWQAVQNDLMIIYKRGIVLKTVFYLLCFFLLAAYGVDGAKDFLYFQF